MRLNKQILLLFAIGLFTLLAISFATAAGKEQSGAKDVMSPFKEQVNAIKAGINMTYGQCVSDAAQVKNTCYDDVKQANTGCKAAAKNESSRKAVSSKTKKCTETYKKDKSQCMKVFKDSKKECAKIKHSTMEAIANSFK